MSGQMSSWIPVTSPEDIPNYRDMSELGDKINSEDVSNDSLPFLEQSGEEVELVLDEPVEVIVSRVLYALLISVSLVMNLLLIIAVLRTKCRVPVIYLLLTAMILPDIIFYTKVIVELMNWGLTSPSWSRDDMSCGLWQFASHLYPLLYSCLLVTIVYHAFVTLFLDTRGSYEKGCRRLLPLLLLALVSLLTVISAPSGFYSKKVTSSDPSSPQSVTSSPGCLLSVPPISGSEVTPDLAEQARVTYRLTYEIVLPYLVPLLLLAFPYLCLLLGLMRGLQSTEHASYSTKMTVVVTLWVLTSFLMLQVPTLLRNIFSIFSVWHRLTALFDAVDDPRVPIFQTYIHVTAYVLTILWAVIRPALCFKYSIKLRKALGP